MISVYMCMYLYDLGNHVICVILAFRIEIAHSGAA